jgi:hypothetical protein
VVETIESKRRSRTARIALTIGLVAVTALVAYGFSRSDDDDRLPGSDTPPTIGVIQAPADVLISGPVAVPGTADLAIVPASTSDIPSSPNGTADIVLTPVSSDIPAP